MLTVTQISAVIASAFFVLIQNPESYAYIGCYKQLTRKNNNCLYFIILDQPFADFKSIAVAQSTVCEQEACNSVCSFQVRKYVQNPSIVGVAFRGSYIICPARIIF